MTFTISPPKLQLQGTVKGDAGPREHRGSEFTCTDHKEALHEAPSPVLFTLINTCTHTHASTPNTHTQTHTMDAIPICKL